NWRAGDHRPIPGQCREKVESPERVGIVIAPWVRRAGTGAFFGTCGAFSRIVCRKQYADRKLHQTGAVVPRITAPGETGFPEAAGDFHPEKPVEASQMRQSDGRFYQGGFREVLDDENVSVKD